MTLDDLIGAANAYASLAEVAATEPHTDAPAATTTLLPFTITLFAEC